MISAETITRIRELRQKRWSYRSIAVELGLDQKTVARYAADSNHDAVETRQGGASDSASNAATVFRLLNAGVAPCDIVADEGIEPDAVASLFAKWSEMRGLGVAPDLAAQLHGVQVSVADVLARVDVVETLLDDSLLIGVGSWFVCPRCRSRGEPAAQVTCCRCGHTHTFGLPPKDTS
jgi:transcriptional regulator with XRE-family HTH domain